jgi:HEAT repeat protein
MESLGRIKHSSSLPLLEGFLKLSQIAPDTTNAQNPQLEKNRTRAKQSIEEILAALLGLKGLPNPKREEDDFLTKEPSEAEQEKLRILNAYQSLLSHQDAVVRADVMMALAERGPEWAELLIEGLSDADIKVRREAVRGLGKTRAPQAVGPLLNVLEKDSNNTVRRAAAESLGKIGERAALPPLKAALQDQYLIVRIGAALGLANMGEPGMLDELLGVMTQEDTPNFRFLIARAFVDLRDAGAIPYLEEIVRRWQAEEAQPGDADFFKSTSEALAELKSLFPSGSG